MSKALDLVGKVFGMLTVVSRAENAKDGTTKWNCVCSCKNHTKCVVRGSKLVSGHTTSCGCIRRKTGFPSDLTGLTFGKLTVIEKDSAKRKNYLCRCSCDAKSIVSVSRGNLINGHTKSCGCHKREMSSIRNSIDLSGRTFGRLTVLRRIGSNKQGNSLFECRCSCPNHTIVVVSGGHLTNCDTVSCGCYQNEMRISSHTKWKTQEEKDIISHYRNMKQRCYDVNYTGYENWGGRGIYICDEWLNDPSSFVKWSLEHGFRKDLWIERIDNDGPYSPDNCRWTTQLEQMNNKRSNVVVSAFGMSHTLSEWSRKIDIPYDELYRMYVKDCGRLEMLIMSVMFEQSLNSC